MHFSQGSIPKSLVKKNKNSQYYSMFFESQLSVFFSPNFQGLILVKNVLIYYTGWAYLPQFLMACSKLEAMAIYVVKQACGNDILASV